jgi:hypothetical protein
MKQNEILLLVGGGLLLYLLSRNSAGVQAAQNAINASNLTAANTVANTNLIASAASGISNDIGDIFG